MTMNNMIPDKQMRKAERKQKRAQHMIIRDIGITVSHEVSKNVAFCNVGLVTGANEKQIEGLCSQHGDLEKIIMLPGKSYCFAVFQTEESAVNAYKNIHGLTSHLFSTPLYLAYAKSVPEVQMTNFQIPTGITLLEEFISAEEEKKLLDCVDWSKCALNSDLKHRSVIHYGYEFRYDINNVDKNDPLKEKIPEDCNFIERKLSQMGFSIHPLDQLTVNRYQPGQGIPMHVDTHSAFEDNILSLSLGSGIKMEFQHQDGRRSSIFLPRRSLLIMSGEARYDWSHGIICRKNDVVESSEGLTVVERGIRTSFTFRTVRKGECDCKYFSNCDSYKKLSSTSPNQLESKYVHNVYNNIASHFSDTRHKPWPNVLEFVQSFKDGSILVDVGCGNGKYFGHNKNIFEMGMDRNLNLLEVCYDKGNEVFNGDCLTLPLKTGIATGCISIAVIHHLSTQERRQKAIEEIIRILEDDGRALIYVWAKDQEKDKKISSYLKQDRKNRRKFKCTEVDEPNTNLSLTSNPAQRNEVDDTEVAGEINRVGRNSGVDCSISGEQILPFPVHKNRTQFQHQDLLVPWKIRNSDSVYYRYYHVFDEGELVELCQSVEGTKIKKSFYDQGNWCVELQKISQ